MPAVYDLQTHFAAQIHQASQESSRVYEAVIGVVTDNKDPSKIGRVKVKVPILSDDDTTFWLPIVMLGAGKNRGWFFIPEPDDEVLVMFEHGDMDRGVVIGSLWNGKDSPPDNNKDGKNDRRVVKSRQGSRVVMDDGDSPNVIIEDGTGKGRITIDTKNNKIIIEALEGDVCFQTPQGEMKIVAKAVDMKATQAGVEVHAGSTMAWGTDAGATISGQGGVTMSGSSHNNNNGAAQAPAAPTSTPQDVDDPYGS
ncbi:MAG TPA: phage baseplate assembly protein V [Kofleriaceae bacterium]|jgi:phage baseplate assembly protein V